MNYRQLSMILQMRKLKPREGGGLSKGEWDILPGALAPGILMSFLPSVVINWQVLTLRINYWWKCKSLFKRMCLPAVHLMVYFHYTPQPLESARHRADASPFLLKSLISHSYISYIIVSATLCGILEQ